MAGARSPGETVAAIDAAAQAKLGLANSRLAGMSVLGGMFIAVGALLAVVLTGSSTGLLADNPGLSRLLLGAVFPIGFIAVVLTGAGLFTSDCATTMVPWYRRQARAASIVRLLAVAYLANLIGAVGFALLARSAGLLGPDLPWTDYLLALAHNKVSHSWLEVFSKGIIANALVCTAAWQAYSSGETTGKVLGIWFPVMAFVALGTEHSIANLFFIPAAMLSGSEIGVGQFLSANLVPATVGNWVGGALLIGLPYAWLYAKRSVSVAVNTRL